MFATAGRAGDAEFNLTELGPGLYVHQGRHAGLEDAGRDDIANIGFIAGDECIAVIDTGGSIATGAALRNAIKARSALPICYVINTHIHFDHVLGNAAFKPDNPKFVGHENLKEEMAQNRSFFLSEFAANLGAAPGPDSIVGPDLVVTDQLELDLGNRTLTLTAHPPAHSYTDVSIYDEKTGVLWLSDLLFIDRIPALDGSLKGWLAVLEKLKALGGGPVIPGHGAPPAAAWPEAGAAQEAYLLMLLTDTREAIAQGAFMEEVIETVGEEEKQRWLLHEENHRRNVTRAFTELEWE